MQLRAVVLFIVFGFSTVSQAASVSVWVPSLDGLYSTSSTYPTSRVGAFNLGVQFSSITSVSLALTGMSTPGVERTCDAVFGCVDAPFDPMMDALLVSSEVVPQPLGYNQFDFTAANSINVAIAPYDFSNPSFLSGYGFLALSVLNPASIGIVLTDAIIDASNVRLTVEGTVVPIPAALPLLMSGLTGLLFFQRKRKRA